MDKSLSNIIKKVKIYLGGNNFTQALLVMLATKIISGCMPTKQPQIMCEMPQRLILWHGLYIPMQWGVSGASHDMCSVPIYGKKHRKNARIANVVPIHS